MGCEGAVFAMVWFVFLTTVDVTTLAVLWQGCGDAVSHSKITVLHLTASHNEQACFVFGFLHRGITGFTLSIVVNANGV